MLYTLTPLEEMAAEVRGMSDIRMSDINKIVNHIYHRPNVLAIEKLMFLNPLLVFERKYVQLYEKLLDEHKEEFNGKLEELESAAFISKRPECHYG